MSDLSDHKAAAARRKEDRAARRKAELMANMARRKAQMRGRALGSGAGNGGAADDGTAGADLPEDTEE